MPSDKKWGQTPFFSALREAPLTAAEAPRALRLALTHEERARSRLAAMLPDGTAVALRLPRGTLLRDGALLQSEDGALLLVEAAAQPLTRISAESPLALLRAVYHLANRHVPAQLAEDGVLIERDPVLERMLAALGAKVEHIEAPFEPEAGAYQAHAAHHTHGAQAHGGEDEDAAAGAIGEALSIAAHRHASPPLQGEGPGVGMGGWANAPPPRDLPNYPSPSQPPP
jgi:urease accessory protein